MSRESLGSLSQPLKDVLAPPILQCKATHWRMLPRHLVGVGVKDMAIDARGALCGVVMGSIDMSNR